MALESSLSSLIQQCETAVVADPTVSVNFNTTVDQLVPYVLNLTCPNDCSNRGSCNQGIHFNPKIANYTIKKQPKRRVKILFDTVPQRLHL